MSKPKFIYGLLYISHWVLTELVIYYFKVFSRTEVAPA